jgi:hypothetical protein
MLGLLAGCAYFSFKLYRIYQQKTTTYAHVYKVSVGWRRPDSDLLTCS